MSKSNMIEILLDEEILTLLVERGFSKEDAGTLCYKEVIKKAIFKLINFVKNDVETNQYGSLISSMCALSSNFYQEVYEEIVNKNDNVLNIKNIDELHLSIREALPRYSEEFTAETYMLKAHAFACSIFGKLKKSNLLNNIGLKNNDGEFSYIDARIMSLLGAYGFDKNALGTFCYAGVIKSVISYLKLKFDDYAILEKRVNSAILNLNSLFYIDVWRRLSSTRYIKRLELENMDKGFEFNFACMHSAMKDAISKSDLALELGDKAYIDILFNNVKEIATTIINDSNELKNGKPGSFGKIRHR